MPELLRHVGIAGLGLVGGSLARDLLARGVEVTGYDRDPSKVERSPGAGGARFRLVHSAGEVMTAPVVVIAVPVAAALDLLAELAPHVTPAHLVMDVGSTKRDVVARAAALGIGARFIGCHPLAGDHRSGWAASREGLFAGAPVFLCPGREADPAAVARAAALWRALGGRPQLMTPEGHDEHVALISHLPHMLSVALALTLADAGIPRNALGPGGHELTRLAGSSPEMWGDIAAQNRPALVAALVQLENQLCSLRSALETTDAPGGADDAGRFLRSARDWSAA